MHPIETPSDVRLPAPVRNTSDSNRIFGVYTAVAILACAAVLLPSNLRAQHQVSPESSVPLAAAGDANGAAALASVAAQKPVFIENKGQWDSRAKFLLRSPGLDLWVTSNGVVYDLNRVERAGKQTEPRGPRLAESELVDASGSRQMRVTRTPVFVTFEGASKEASAVGNGKLPEYHNYLIGNDPSKWAEHVALYSDAHVQGLYKGVDALFYLDGGRPRYDLVVGPGADPSSIGMKIEGATGINVANNGTLVIATELGTIEQRELFAYQEAGGKKTQVPCAFVAQSDGRVRFAVGQYDRTRPLVIDPVVYSTYLGGSNSDEGYAIVADASGNAYVTGHTLSINFPTSNGTIPVNLGNDEAFVTKLTSTGAFAYSTYLGGGSNDVGFGIAVDGNGNAYVSGATASTNFPTANAFQSNLATGTDAFVTRLTVAGTLSFSTYLGANGNDVATAIALDPNGNLNITGYTSSTNFPVANATQASYGGGSTDAFVTKLPNNGAALLYSSYLGGSNQDVGRGIAVDGSGNRYITGLTTSTNFPTANAIQAVNGGGDDAFITKLNSGNAFSYSTYLGGTGADGGRGIAVDGSGNAYVAGTTASTNFPTANASQSTTGGSDDAFVTKLNSAGSALVYSTFLGGSGAESGGGIAVDGGGNTFVAGSTGSTNFPIVAATQGTNGGVADAFVTKLSSSGVASFSTYLGGSNTETGNAIATDGNGNAYVTGGVVSSNFPTTNPVQGSHGGGTFDAFVTKLSIPNATVTVTIPNGGEEWCAGSTQSITWTQTGISNVKIELSSNSGGSFGTTIVASTPAASGTYSWAIPSNQAVGTAYRIRVSDAANAAVNDPSNADFTIASPPSIIQAPQSRTICGGQTTTFNVSATGFPLRYKWQKGGVDLVDGGRISGATTGQLTITGALPADNGNYAVLVQNACTTVTHTPATLTVNPTITVSLAPNSIKYEAYGKMRTIYATIVNDASCSISLVVLESITANEAMGATDVQYASFNTSPADMNFNVAAKRNTSAPRIYTVTYKATLSDGSVYRSSATVTVPTTGGM